MNSKDYNQNQKDNICISNKHEIDKEPLRGTKNSYLTDDKIQLVKRIADTVAHDIRNPLISIKDLVQLLSEGINNPKYYAMIYSEINKVEATINEFTQLENSKHVNFNDNDIRLVLERTIRRLKEIAVQKGINIITCLESSRLSIYCDEIQLSQVIENIIKNAIEASTYYKKIYITCQTNESHLNITVKDQGVGIPKEKMKYIFEPDYTEQETSTGFGLMYSQKVINDHHGTIQIKSEVEVGTTVDIYLPLLNSSS